MSTIVLPRSAFARLTLTLMLPLFAALAPPAWAANRTTSDRSAARPSASFSGDRIHVDHHSFRQPLVDPVAHQADAPVGRLIQNDVRPVAYTETFLGCDATCGIENSCGCESVCDCPLVAEPLCGCEGVGCSDCCDSAMASCGCESCLRQSDELLGRMFPRLGVRWNQLELFAGVAGFTGPMNFANVSATGLDRRGAGSFGFYQGFNKGSSLAPIGGDLSHQYGVRFIQANLSGTGFTTDTRQQVFASSAIFRRVDYGLQFGVGLDYLYDDWYYGANIAQIRGELGWRTHRAYEFGFQFAAGIDDDTSTTQVFDSSGTLLSNQISLGAISQYRLFFRHSLASCAEYEGFVGWTDDDKTLLGINLDAPLSSRFAWNTRATYLTPGDANENAVLGHIEEGWNLSIGVTFFPGSKCGRSRYHRPLMNVADNGTLMIDRL